MGNNPIIWFCTRLVASHYISAGVTMRTEGAALTIARITSDVLRAASHFRFAPIPDVLLSRSKRSSGANSVEQVRRQPEASG